MDEIKTIEGHALQDTAAREAIANLNTSKEDKSTVNTQTDAEVNLTPASNTEYRYGALTSLSITIPTPKDDYTAYIVFTSGTTPTELSYPDTLKWSGDDVIDGIFTPLVSRRYNIGIWYDGVNINAVARGVSV